MARGESEIEKLKPRHRMMEEEAEGGGGVAISDQSHDIHPIRSTSSFKYEYVCNWDVIIIRIQLHQP